MSTHDLLRQADVLWTPREIVEVRLLRDGKGLSRWMLASELPALIDALTAENRDGWNIYIGIGARIEHGRRGDDAVLHVRCLFADFDGGATVAEVLARIEAAGLPTPTLVIWSGHGVHCYWLLAEPLIPEHWRVWQKDLAALLGSDPTVHNPERITRAAGFLNTKKEPHVPAYVVSCDRSLAYDLADLPIPMRAGSDTPAPLFKLRRVIDPAHAGDPYARCRAYLAKLPPAVSGDYGHYATYHAACTANRFGVSKLEAIELLSEYSDRCQPPWAPHDIVRKVEQAYARNAHEHGQKLRERREPLFTVRRVA